MTEPALLAELRARDIRVWADGDRLHCDAPAGVLTPELRDHLRQCKSEILEFLRGPAELSFSQQRLWFLDQIEPGGAAYIIAGALELRGALDAPVLERALGALVQPPRVAAHAFSRASRDGRCRWSRSRERGRCRWRT